MTIRILILDDPFALAIEGGRFWDHPGIEAHIVLPRENRKSATAEARAVAYLPRAGDYDIIVIGNNQGVGLELASLVHSELRPYTAIVWFSDSPMHERPEYEALGYTEFLTRDQLSTWFAELVA